MERRSFLEIIAGSLFAVRLRAGAPHPGQSTHMMVILLSAFYLLAVTHAGPSAAQDWHSAQRARMVAEIASLARETSGATGRPTLREAVMTAMGTVPRHRFVPAPLEVFAYKNQALPIGEGQTISQPF